MKKSAEFVKATVIGGLVALVPLALLVAIAVTVIPVIVEAANLLSEFLPFDPVTNMLIALVAGVLLLVALCFFVGLALMTGPGDALRRRVDGLLERIVPLYGAARRLAERVTGMEGDDFWPVAVDLYGSGTRVMGMLVERLPEGRSAVFVPMAPTAALGNVYIVPDGGIERIDAPVPEAIGVITEWGVGSARLFRERGRGASVEGRESDSPGDSLSGNSLT